MRFRTIVADPPWQYGGDLVNMKSKNKRRCKTGRFEEGVMAEDRYPTMTVDEIASLPVRAIVRADAHLYLWVTNRFMESAYHICRAWGFRPVTIITWTKHYKDNPSRPSMKVGYYFRSATEHCLFGVRGSQRLLKTTPAVSTAFLHPRLPHSVKPQPFMDMVKEYSPGPRLEMFARRCHEGFVPWGNDPAIVTPPSVRKHFERSSH